MTFETNQRSSTVTTTPPTGYLKSSALILLTAVASVTIVFVAARATGDQLRVTPEFSSAPASSAGFMTVAGATLTLGLLSLVVAGFVGRFVPRPRLVLLGGAVIGLAGYGVLAFVKADTTATALWLNIMHLAAAVPIVWGCLSHRTTFLPGR